jgi:hypothetical protein
VKALRPQALPVKLMAVGAFTAALNIPCGMWREHTEKFSWQWIVAVHASIPFVAMLRKAVVMPKIAIACTIAMAIAGQAIGVKMERERLVQLQVKDVHLHYDATGCLSDAASLVHLQASAKRSAVASVKKARVLVKSKDNALSTAQRKTVSISLGNSSSALSGNSISRTPLLEGSAWRMEKDVGMSSFKHFFAYPPSVCVQ